MIVQKDVVSFGEYEFTCGESIPNLQIAYEKYGSFEGDNAVVLCHALTTGQHAAEPADREGTDGGDKEKGKESKSGSERERAAALDISPESYQESTPWWDDVVGPGKAIDTEQYCVICANAPGSCYGSSGPTSTNPETGEPYGADFPPTRIEDWTDTQRLLLDQLGIDEVHAVVGGSIGGMNVLDWAKRYPDMVDRVVPIAATARLDAQSIAFDALARRAITADPNWCGGDYYDETHPDQGLQLARQLGLIRYLSKHTLAEQYGTEPTDREVQRPFPEGPFTDDAQYRSVESFLDAQAQTFVTRFDANSYLSLLRALDEYDLARGYDSNADALADFDGEALVLSFTGDWYYPVEESETIERAFRSANIPVTHKVIQSPYGHDTFLAKSELIAPLLQTFISDGLTGVADTEPIAETTASQDAG